MLPMSSLSCLACEVISETMPVVLAQKHEVRSLRTKRTMRWEHLVAKPEAILWLLPWNILYLMVALKILSENFIPMRIMPMIFLVSFHHPKWYNQCFISLKKYCLSYVLKYPLLNFNFSFPLCAYLMNDQTIQMSVKDFFFSFLRLHWCWQIFK